MVDARTHHHHHSDEAGASSDREEGEVDSDEPPHAYAVSELPLTDNLPITGHGRGEDKSDVNQGGTRASKR